MHALSSATKELVQLVQGRSAAYSGHSQGVECHLLEVSRLIKNDRRCHCESVSIKTKQVWITELKSSQIVVLIENVK